MNPNPNQLLLYKLYFTMSISNWLVFMVSVSVRCARAYINTVILHIETVTSHQQLIAHFIYIN